MVDNFFVQWSNVAFIIVEHCQYCRFKKQLGFIFLVLTTIQTMDDNFFVQYIQWSTIFYLQWSNVAFIIVDYCRLTSSSCHPKIFVKEFCYFLMPCHQHCLGVNLLVQR